MQLYLPAVFGKLEFHIFHFQKETLQCYFVRKLENESNFNRKIEIEISLQLLSIPQKPFGSSRLRFMHHFEEKDVFLISHKFAKKNVKRCPRDVKKNKKLRH